MGQLRYIEKRFRTWIIIAFVIGSFLWSPLEIRSIDTAYAGDHEVNVSEPLDIKITIDKNIFELSEPIILTWSIHNKSTSFITLPPILFMDFMVDVEYEDLSEPHHFGPRILSFGDISKKNIVKLKPGETRTFTRTIDKSTYFMPEKIGRYKLFGEYSNKLERMDDVIFWRGSVKSNDMHFQIVEHAVSP